MKKHTIVFWLILLSLCTGLFIYAGTRTDALMLNQIFSSLTDPVIKISGGRPFLVAHLPSWFMYSLPDALWMIALMMTIMMIWNFKINRTSLPWLAGAFAVGLLFEIGQGLHLVRGTFDVTDLLCIFIGASIPISFTLLKINLWKTK